MSKDNPNYWSVIPANVRYDKRLRPNEKLLYGEITSLCNFKGVCWATNTYFATLYNVDKKTISKWINNLKDYGYIRIEILYKTNTKVIDKRKIFIEEGIHQIVDTYPQKNGEGIHQKMEDNNTSINNNKKYIKSSEEVIEYLNSKTGKRFRICQSNQKKIITVLKEGYSIDECKQVIDTKCEQWLHNSEFQKNLNPKTLFSLDNFDRYLNEKISYKKERGTTYIEY